MKQNKKSIIVLICLILFFLLSLSGLIFCSVRLIQHVVESGETVTEKDKTDMILSSVGSGITFISTMILGIVAYWQTCGANAISTLLAKKETASSILWEPEYHWGLKNEENFAVSLAGKFDQEALYCSEREPKEALGGDKDEKIPFLVFSVDFKTENSPLDSIYINSLEINGALAELNKSFYLKFNIHNKDGAVAVSYNPSTQVYSLNLYLNCDFGFLKTVNDNNLFVLTLAVTTVSINGITQKTRYDLYFNTIEKFDEVVFGKNSGKSAVKKKKDQFEKGKLEKIIIHRGEMK